MDSMKVMRIFWEKYFYCSYRRKSIIISKIVHSCIYAPAETCLSDLEGTIKLLHRNAFQKRCHMRFDVLRTCGLPMFSFQFSLQSREQKKVTWGYTGAVRWLEDHWGPASGQEVGDDEGRVAGGVVVVEFDRVFDVSPRAQTFCICRSSVKTP